MDHLKYNFSVYICIHVRVLKHSNVTEHFVCF